MALDSPFTPTLPDVFPLDEVLVENEAHTYTTYEDTYGDVIAEQEYEFEKGPVSTVEDVTGIVDGEPFTFLENTDYEVSADQERLVWLDSGTAPDPGSRFEITYRSETVMGRYIQSHTDELDAVSNDLQQLQEARFVDKAEGNELDRIGDLFGVLGRRLDRDDDQYRIYLKSIVQSFVSRGTRDDIKTALSAATDVPVSDIQINENFEQNEYEINILAATPITGSLVEDVSEIADPSGVDLARTRFSIPAEETAVNDDTSFSFGMQLADVVGTADTVSVPGATTATETTAVSDPVTVAAPTTTSDVAGASDTLTTDPQPAYWGSGEWGAMRWD